MDLGEGDLIKGVFLPYFRLFENGGGAGGVKMGIGRHILMEQSLNYKQKSTCRVLFLKVTLKST
jgi:hypothetical protein